MVRARLINYRASKLYSLYPFVALIGSDYRKFLCSGLITHDMGDKVRAHARVILERGSMLLGFKGRRCGAEGRCLRVSKTTRWGEKKRDVLRKESVGSARPSMQTEAAAALAFGVGWSSKVRCPCKRLRSG